MSITFTNIYLTYKKENYYVYKIYEDDYSTQHGPENRSQCGVHAPPPVRGSSRTLGHREEGIQWKQRCKERLAR